MTPTRRPLTQPHAARLWMAPRRGDRGFAMIEALIALLIFMLGALGVLGLQVSLTRATSGAKFRADAAYLANDLVGTMWADSANLAAYASDCSNHVPCRNWTAKVQNTLPGNVAPTLSIDPATATVEITLNWVVPNEPQHSYTTITSINRNP
jgi:type IV pilus assembly protein PilV